MSKSKPAIIKAWRALAVNKAKARVYARQYYLAHKKVILAQQKVRDRLRKNRLMSLPRVEEIPEFH